MSSTFSFGTKNGKMITKAVSTGSSSLPPYYVTPLSSSFTSSKTITVSGQPFGNGVYTLTTSGNYDGTDKYAAFNVFNGNSSGGSAWVAGGTFSDGSRTTNVSGNNITGDWIQLKLPYSLILGRYSLLPWNASGSATQWYIVGSNDGSTWNQLDYRNSIVLNSSSLNYYTVTNSVSYSYFRIIVTSYTGYTYCALSQFNIGN